MANVVEPLVGSESLVSLSLLPLFLSPPDTSRQIAYAYALVSETGPSFGFNAYTDSTSDEGKTKKTGGRGVKESPPPPLIPAVGSRQQ